MVVSGVNHDVASAWGFDGAAEELSGAESFVQNHGSRLTIRTITTPIKIKSVLRSFVKKRKKAKVGGICEAVITDRIEPRLLFLRSRDQA